MDVRERTLNDIWDGLLDAARLARVYDRLAKYNGLARLATRLLLALSAVGCLAVIGDWWSPVAELGVGVSALLLAVTALDMAADFSRKRAVLGDIAHEQSRLETKWKRLDGEADWLTDEEARARADKLLERHERLDKRANELGVITFDLLNRRCAKQAYRVHAPASYDQRGRLLHP